MAKRGRPDESVVRRDQILDATMRCIAQRGLQGASLEAIAQESGMTRGNVRHYLGNREELLLALIERINERDQAIHSEIAAIPDRVERMRAIWEYLYSPGFGSADLENAVMLDLALAARTDAAVRSALARGYAHIIESLAATLSDSTEIPVTAHVLLALAVGSASLSELEVDGDLADSVRLHAASLLQ